MTPKPMHHANEQQWQQLCQHLDIAASQATLLFGELVARYGETHRAYHTLQHIDHCLALYHAARHLAAQPQLLAAAIWLHDLIYQPRRHDNEAASAKWAAMRLANVGVATADIATIETLILHTEHRAVPPAGDGALLVDIDLAILGSDADRFAAYEVAIRHEYAWVPWPTFCTKRAALLQQFLERPVIYQTPYFHEHFEQQARHNLRDAIQRLSCGWLENGRFLGDLPEK